MFRKATELAPADHRLWGNLADALLFGGRPAEAERAYARALDLAEGELAINPKLAVNQAQTAYYSSRLGTVTGPDSASRTPWPTGITTVKCTITWAGGARAR